MTRWNKVTFKCPDGVFPNAKFRFRSMYGHSGCEGFVRPGILNLDGDTRYVQTKVFYKTSYDDEGNYFSQNPEVKVHESYEVLSRLNKLGFRTVPFFGIIIMHDKPYLVISDLTEGGEIEVYDEKDVHRNRATKALVDGKMVSRGATEIVNAIENISDIHLGFLRTALLQRAYDISLGYGVSHMITRDPNTNRGNVFVTDVGEFEQHENKYRKVLPIDTLLTLPQAQISDVFYRLLQKHHKNHADAYSSDIVALKKRGFQELLYKSAVGLSLRNWIGGWSGDADWGRKRFVRNSFPDHFMRVKLDVHQTAESFQHITGHPLLYVDRNAHDTFLYPDRLEDILIGLDFAYLSVLDSKIQYLMVARESIDEGGNVPDKIPTVEFEEDGFPEMRFFDRYNETRGDSCVIEIRQPPIGIFRKEVSLQVEFDWNTAYDVSTSGGTRAPIFSRSQVKGLTIDGVPIDNFSQNKLRLSFTKKPEIGDWVYYLYGEEPVYFGKIRSGDDLARLL